MGLNRPYIRKNVREEVEHNAKKNEKGQFLDANTEKPIEGQYDLGHKAGHEHRRNVAKAEQEGLTQAEFNDRMNNPEYYQIEDPSENRSRKHEMKDDPKQDSLQNQNKKTEQGILKNGGDKMGTSQGHGEFCKDIQADVDHAKAAKDAQSKKEGQTSENNSGHAESGNVGRTQGEGPSR